MSAIVRIPAALYAAALADLERPHEFAAERIGFFSSSFGVGPDNDLIVCLTSYHPIDDAWYVNDPRVGARINSSAIRSAMQRALDGAGGQIHVHVHAHRGQPGPSGTDLRDSPALVRSLVATAPNEVHGTMILSLDSGWAGLWLPGATQLVRTTRISVVGFPLRFFR